MNGPNFKSEPYCQLRDIRKTFESILLMIALLIITGDLHAQSPNDECADAIAITCGESLAGSTIGDVADPVGLCGTSASAPGVWYSFLGTGDNVTFSTCNNADYDTKISVFTDGCGTLTCVDGNDDAPGCSNATSEVTIVSIPGQEYLVYVHGFSSQEGNFVLSAFCGSGGNNDNCASAIEVSCGQVISGSTIDATPDDLEVPVCITAVSAPGVWYFFQGNGDLVTASLCSGATLYDSKISVYQGFCGGLTCVVDNDDACGLQSEVDFITVAGATYYILVHGFGSNEGDFELTLFCSPIVLANDDCADAEVVTDGPGQPFSNFGATTDGLPDVLCENFGNDQIFSDIWYSYTATCDGIASFSTDGGTTYDTRVAVYTSPCPGNILACNDDVSAFNFQSTVFWPVTAGTEYIIRLGGFDASGQGAGTFNLSCSVAGQPNDFCSDASPVACGDVVTGSTTGALNEGEDCGTAVTAPNVWYKLTGTGDVVTATTCSPNTLYDTKISVYEGSCGALTCITGNDDDAGCVTDGLLSSVQWLASAGSEYYILVHGFAASEGDFELSLTCTPPLANDECTDVSPVTLTTGVPVTFNGTTEGATASAVESGTLGAAAVWEAVTLTGTCNNLTIDFCGTGPGIMETAFIVYADCPTTVFTPGTFETTTCPDGNVTISFIKLPAGTYYIPVLADGNFNPILGDYTLNVLGEDCPPPPANDIPCGAEVLTVGVPAAFDNSFATADAGEITPGPGTEINPGDLGCLSQDGWCNLPPEPSAENSLWYTFVAPASGSVVIDAGPIDGQLAVYEVGDCADYSTFTVVAANDDRDLFDLSPLITSTSCLDAPLIPGATYYVQLDGFDGTSGAGVISVSELGCLNNFDCASAAPVTDGAGQGFTNIGATTDGTPDALCASFGNDQIFADIYYSYTASCNGLASFSTVGGTSVDTRVAIYLAPCPGTIIACNDDAGGTLQSAVSWSASAGTEYIIRLGGFSDADQGIGTFDLACSPPPLNDDCASVTPATLSAGTPVTFTGNTSGASASPEELAVLGAGAVWEAVTLTGECNVLTVDYCGTATGIMETAFIAYADCPLTIAEIGVFDFITCPDGNVTIEFNNLAAGTYYIPVLADANFNILGDYTINVLVQDCPPPPANDDVCNAALLPFGVPVTFDNTLATAQPGEIVPGAGSDPVDGCNSQDGWCGAFLGEPAADNTLWYYFIAPASGHVSIAAGDFDLQLAVYEAGTCSDFSSFSLLAANDDSNPDFDFSPFIDGLSCLTPGQTYYVQLDGFTGASGSGTIILTDEGITSVITGFTLVDAVTNLDIGPLNDGDVLNLFTLPPFNIRADVCAPVGSVDFILNGSLFNIEGRPPYAMAWDNNGNYQPWNTAAVGSYTLTSTPYASWGGNGGPVGLSETVNFTIIDEEVDCNGTPNGTAVLDINGDCCEPEDIDCAGVCFGGATQDGPSYLTVENFAMSWRKLKLGNNPNSLWFPRIDPTDGGNNTTLSLTLRDTNEDVDWSKIQIRPQGQGSLALGSYIPAGGVTSDWTVIDIPLADFGPGVVDLNNLSVIEVPYSNGHGPFEIHLQRVEFTGGPNPYVWFGDPVVDNANDGQSGTGSALTATLVEADCVPAPSCPLSEMTVEITTDVFGIETGWTLTDLTDGIVLGFASEGDLDDNTAYSETFCVDPSHCFEFTITDAFGDGIIAPGFYAVTLDGVPVAAGGNFGSVETTVIGEDCCDGVELVLEITTDNFANETSAEVIDLTDGVVIFSLPAGALDNNTSYSQTLCVDPTHCFEASIFDSFGDGICCAEGLGSYSVYLDGILIASGGDFGAVETTQFGSNCPLPATNDLCDDAIDIGCGETLSGNTNSASFDDVGFCETSNTSPGVWYHFVGDGNLTTASLCGSSFDTKISVFEGSCGALICVDGNDDACGLQSEITWSSDPGTDYFILVHGFASSTGAYDLSVNCAAPKTGFNALIAREAAALSIEAYPNPFRDQITFEFAVSEGGPVKLDIFSVTGVKIATVFEGTVKANESNFKMFYPVNLASGFYMYRLQTNTEVYTNKVLLAK